MVTAVAAAADLPVADVRRAHMLDGDLGDVARIALAEGAPGLARIGLEVGRPIHPMLAQPADSLEDALARTSPAAVETKLDGVRIQAHRSGADVALFTRTLDDVTARLPELVEAVLALPGDRARPRRRGDRAAARTGGHIRSRSPRRASGSAPRREDLALTPQHFDVLHLDGEDLLDRPGSERAADPATRSCRRARAGRPDRRRGPRARAGGLRRRARRGPRGRRREGARRALRRRSPGRRLAEGQAAPHARPRRARGGVGPRAAARVAEQPASRRARPRRRRS